MAVPADRSKAKASRADVTPAGEIVIASNARIERVVVMTDAQRHDAVSQAAYYLAEQRGFEAGHEIEDWCKAEAQVDDAIAAANND